jgi:hypothetical protein
MPMMSQELLDFLTGQEADAATLQHAVRYLVAERSSDATATEMSQRLVEAAGDATLVDHALRQLETDGPLLEALDLAVLQGAWEDDGLRDLVRGAVIDAKLKLPVVEVTVIAVAALYGAWLARTGGRSRHERVITRNPDGSFEERETTEWYGPEGPLREIGRALSGMTPPTDTSPGDERDSPPPASSPEPLPPG